MLIRMEAEAPAHTHGFACSLDFANCFDQTAPEYGLSVLQDWGVDGRVLRLLRSMGRGQERHLAMAGRYLDAP
eukprot:13294398-Alexandrium_andersonii.AAC.1